MFRIYLFCYLLTEKKDRDRKREKERIRLKFLEKNFQIYLKTILANLTSISISNGLHIL